MSSVASRLSTAWTRFAAADELLQSGKQNAESWWVLHLRRHSGSAVLTTFLPPVSVSAARLRSTVISSMQRAAQMSVVRVCFKPVVLNLWSVGGPVSSGGG
jgi:hypothetical protein